MILLDTNVVSETMRPAPDTRVIAWLDSQAAEIFHLSTVTLAELLLGVAILRDGKRKAALRRTLTDGVAALFGPRLLPFDAAAAEVYAQLVSDARARGLAIGVSDGMIAAIAKHHGLMVATRDIAPFEAAGVPVVNPWAVN